MKTIRKEFLAECHEDYVGLWSLVWTVEHETGELDPQAKRVLTIRLVTELLQSGLIKAGMPNAEGEFEAWRIGVDQIIYRIEREWDQLESDPNIGDIVWFTTTEKGDAQVKPCKPAG